MRNYQRTIKISIYRPSICTTPTSGANSLNWIKSFLFAIPIIVSPCTYYVTSFFKHHRMCACRKHWHPYIYLYLKVTVDHSSVLVFLILYIYRGRLASYSKQKAICVKVWIEMWMWLRSALHEEATLSVNRQLLLHFEIDQRRDMFHLKHKYLNDDLA